MLLEAQAPELGFEPRSEAPQASRISKLPHSGMAPARRHLHDDIGRKRLLWLPFHQ
jgi:hypothetical protein